MKSFFRIACLSFLLFATYQSTAQTTWNEIPAIPANPSAGQTSPGSYTHIIDESGRNYAVYIEYTAGNYELKVQEWLQSSSTWDTQIWNEVLFDGFQDIYPLKATNGDSYFFVKTGNSTVSTIFRLYKVANGTVTLMNSFDYSDIPDGTPYRICMSQDQNYLFMAHEDMNASLFVARFDITTSTASSLNLIPTTPGGYNYDLTDLNDTLFVAASYSQSGTYDNYLYKIPFSFAASYYWNPVNGDAKIGGMTTSSTPNGIILTRDVTDNIIKVYAKDNISAQTCSYHLDNGIMYIGGTTLNHPNPVNQPAVLSYNQRNFVFGAMSDGTGNPYISDLYFGAETTTSLNPSPSFGFNNIGSSMGKPKLSFSGTKNRLAVEYYDGVLGSNRYYLSNDLPSVQNGGNVMFGCPTVNSLLYQGIEINDSNGDQIQIFDVTASNSSIFPNGTLQATFINQSGLNSYFDIYGTAASSGITNITVSFTDGYDTVVYTLPSVTVNAAIVPIFNQATISVCSNNGMIDLSGYVNTPGGTFGIGGVSAPFNGMFFNSNLTGLPYETTQQLDYTVSSVGCNITASTQFIFHESPNVNVTPNATTCGGSTGTAAASISGGVLPYSGQAWSSGQTGVTTVANLAQGTYTFTVQGGNGCTVIKEFTIVPTGVDIVPTITNSSCYGANNGSISTTLTGFTAPTTMIWSSGYSVPSISNLVPGTYTLTVTDASNCIYTEAFTVTEPTQLTATNVVNSPTCGNSDGTMEVQNIAGGVGPYGVSWSSGGTNALETNVAYGVYSATITDNTGCQTIKTFYVSEQNSGNLAGTITGSQCGSNTGGIDVTPLLVSGTNVQAISWSSGETTEDISMKAAATYVCTLTTDANCHAVKGWNIPIVAPDMQPICVITVDSATSTNLVVWEKVQPIGIHHYNIYRETSVQGEYILIDTVEATNTSLFNDVVASPIARSWSYKISAVNGCNTEGPLSPQHRTMHLNAIDGGSSQTYISWNPYEGTSYNNFVLSRYTNALGWQTVATLPPTQVTYTDNMDVTTPGLDYMVELNLSQQCTALIYKAQDFNTTRSNKDKGNFLLGAGTGDSNNSLEEWLLDQITVYPNPTNGLLSIEQSKTSELTVLITDLTGKKITTSVQTSLSSVIDLNDLKPGTYIIELTLNNTKRTERIVKI